MMSKEKGSQGKALEPRREQRKTQLRESARQAWRSTALRRCLDWGLRLALGLVMSAGRVLGACSPFGVAFVAACGPGAGGFAALLGSAGGYLLSRGLDEALRYTACCTLVFAVSFAFYDLKIYKKWWFMPLSAALLTALTGFVTLSPTRATPASPSAYPFTPLSLPFSYPFLPALVAEFALTFLCAYAFRIAFTLWQGRRESGSSLAETLGIPAGEAAARSIVAQGSEVTFRQRVCLILLAMTLLISLSDLTLVKAVSVGRILAAFLTVLAGCAAGAGGGAAVGLCAGLAMDLASHGARVYALTLAFSGLSGGTFRKNGRFPAVFTFAITGALAALWSWEVVDPVAMVAEILMGCGLFLAAPQRFLARFNALFSVDPAPSPTDYAAHTAQVRLRETAAAFQQVFSSLKGVFSSKTADLDEDPAVIYDRAANKACAGCALRERCWQSQYQDTHDLLNAALPGLLEARAASPALLPQRFRDKCVKLSTFVAAVDGELHEYLLRQQYSGQVGRSRRAVCRQYAQVAEVLEEAAAAMAAPCALNGLKTRRLTQFLAARGLSCEGLALTDPRGRLRVQITGPDTDALTSQAAVAALSSALDCDLNLASEPTPENPQTVLLQREPLSALAGVAGRKKAGEVVSGDACAWFKDDQGQLYLLLCDGMGSGQEARKESELAVDLLEKFLKAGFSPENSLKMLDQAFGLRLEEALGFSTVDLLTLDLFSGAGTLYKLGSAPSYLKQGGTVKALRSKGFPAGLASEGGGASAPESFSFRLGPGDCVVLLTDGVFDEEGSEKGAQGVGEGHGSGGEGVDDRWLREVLMGFEGGSPAGLAEVIAEHNEAATDDKTALVLRVALRGASDFPEAEKAAV